MENEKLRTVNYFGVEFRTRKYDSLNLDHFLARTYRCSTWSLAEKIFMGFNYVYVDRSRLVKYANDCITYLKTIGGDDFSNLRGAKRHLLCWIYGVLERNEKIHFEKNDSNKINFDHYDLKDCILGKKYTDKYFDYMDSSMRANYEINMQHFDNLDTKQFEKTLSNFLKKHKEFYEIKDLSDAEFSGCYILVLDKYRQVYIGQSYSIVCRIINHWSNVLEYDRRIFGDYKTSKIAIDCFGYKDTTRIFVANINSLKKSIEEMEKIYIDKFPNEYLTNRVRGGLTFGIPEAKNR